MYKHTTTIKLHDTDAAGVLFFGNQFKLIHDAYQAMLEESGVNFKHLVMESDYALPIVHAESDYKGHVGVGDKLTIAVRLESIGTTSFTLEYTLLNARKDIVGTASTVHAAIDKETCEKIPLPEEIKIALNQGSSVS